MRPRLALPLVTALFALGAAGDAAAQSSNPLIEQEAGVAAIPLVPPDVELGDEFHDEEFGFLFRLPMGMEIVPPAELAEIREKTLVPEEELPIIDGKSARVQYWLFRHPERGSLSILMNEPPVMIESPTQLRRAIAAEDQQKGRPFEDTGKLYQFKGRGARAGFLITRDFGLEPGKPMTFREHVAYLRGNQRSYLVRYTAPREDFDRIGEDFKASMITFALERGTTEPLLSGETKAKEPELMTPRSIGNVALLVLFVVGGLVWWKKSGAPASE